MNYLQRLGQWGDQHHPKWLDILRIALGIFLCYKGIEFLNNMSSLMSVVQTKVTFGSFAVMLLGHYIVFAHLLGGFFLAIGVLTRFACLIQIPILLGAIILVNASGDVMRPYSELFLSILILLGLIFFLIVGNGPWSLSYLFDEEKKDRRQMPGHA